MCISTVFNNIMSQNKLTATEPFTCSLKVHSHLTFAFFSKSTFRSNLRFVHTKRLRHRHRNVDGRHLWSLTGTVTGRVGCIPILPVKRYGDSNGVALCERAFKHGVNGDVNANVFLFHLRYSLSSPPELEFRPPPERQWAVALLSYTLVHKNSKLSLLMVAWTQAQVVNSNSTSAVQDPHANAIRLRSHHYSVST